MGGIGTTEGLAGQWRFVRYSNIPDRFALVGLSKERKFFA
jgi:hypothetical protein